MKKYFVVLILTLLLLGMVIAPANDDPQSSDPYSSEVDYNELDEPAQRDYLKDRGITGVSELGGVIVEGGRITIPGGEFVHRKVHFSGGKVVFSDGEIITADSVMTDGFFSQKGAAVSGRFSLNGNALVIEQGLLSLGADTAQELEISAAKDCEIIVTRGKGYSGRITSIDGPFEIQTWHEQFVRISGGVEFVDGKIVEAEGIEAIDPVRGVFAAFPEDMWVGLTEGSIRGNKIVAKQMDINGHFFSGDTNFELVAFKDNVILAGKDIAHKDGGVLERIFSSGEGVRFYPESSRWMLSAGTTMSEVRAGEPSVSVRTDKQTLDYYPEHDRSVCDSAVSSCIAIDKWNSMRAKVQGNDEVRVNSFKTMPLLIVDKIDDDSKLFFSEHGLRDEDDELIQFQFSKDDVGVRPPNALADMRTRVVFDFEVADGKMRAFEYDPSGKKISLDDTIVGGLDEWTVRKHYLTTLGDAIPADQVQRYARIIAELEERRLASGENVKVLTDGERDFLMLWMYYNPDNEDPEILDRFAESFLSKLGYLGSGVSREDLFRVAVRTNIDDLETMMESGSIALFADFQEWGDNNFVREELVNIYEKGQVSGNFHLFNSAVFPNLDIDSSYKARRYLTQLVDKLPPNIYESFVVTSGYLSEMYAAYYVGSEGKDEAFYRQMQRMMGTEEVSIGIPRPKSGSFKPTAAEFLADELGVSLDTLTTRTSDPPKEMPSVIEVNGKEVRLVWDKRRKKWDYHVRGRHLSVHGGETINYGGGDSDVWSGLDLDLPEKLSEEELPQFFAAAQGFEKMRGGVKAGERNKLGAAIELWETGLMQELMGWDLSKSGGIESYFSYLGVGGSDRLQPANEVRKGQKILLALDAALADPTISEETHKKLFATYRRTAEALSVSVNRLHNSPGSRQKVVDSLPAWMQVEILSQSVDRLGQDSGVYRSSEEMVLKSLLDKIGGGEELLGYLDRKGYDLESEKTMDVLRMLAACGQLQDVLPADGKQRRVVYAHVLHRLATENPARAGMTVTKILEDSRAKDDFADVLISEYQDTEDEEMKDALQYWIRRHGDLFSERYGEMGVVDKILNSPSDNVRKLEESLRIPIDQMISNSETRGGVPVLKGAVVFTDAQKDKGEKSHFRRFARLGGGFKRVKSFSGGYVLEKKGQVRDSHGEWVSVIFRVECFDDPAVMADIRDDSSYFLVANRGHSYSARKVWDTPPDYQNDIARVGIVGSCIGSNDVSGKVGRCYENTAFFATSGTGVGAINNKLIRGLFEGLEEGKGDYPDLWERMQGEAGRKDDRVAAYQGPETFAVTKLFG